MERFLLALSTTEQSKEAISYALDLAKQRQAELTVLFILDSNVPATIFEKLTDIGFIGERPSAELKEAIAAEYSQQAVKRLEEIKVEADAAGVKCQTFLEAGDFSEKSLEAIGRFAADMIILNRTRRTAISRLFLGSAVDRLLRQAPCEIKIFEEE